MNKKVASCILASSFLLCSCNLNASNQKLNAELDKNNKKNRRK